MLDFDTLAVRVRHALAISQPETARRLLAEHLTEHRGEPHFWLYYAAALLALERNVEAEQAARQGLDLNHQIPNLAELLANAVYAQGRVDEAIALIRVLIEQFPEYPGGHYRFGLFLLSRSASRDDLVLARAAFDHALHLDPEDPYVYQAAAVAADLMDDRTAAQQYLRTGLSLAPQDEGLKLAAMTIDGGEKVVGDGGALLRGMIAQNPTDERLHRDFAGQFVSRAATLSNLLWLHIPVVAALAAFGARASEGARWLVVSLIVLATGALVGYGYLRLRQVAQHMPAGYLKDVMAAHRPLGRAGMVAGAGLLAGAAGAVGAVFEPSLSVSMALLLLGALAAQFAIQGTLRQAAAPVPRTADVEQFERFGLRRSGMLAAGGLRRLLTGGVIFVLIMLCTGIDSPLGGVIAVALGLGLLSTGCVVGYWQLRLGPRRNAWAVGSTISTSARFRRWALVRGNLGALYYVAAHLIGAALFLLMGAALLAEGA
ncbi:hypothetical protein GCM10027417_28310 [Glutamicibacter endophyticus]